jgi:hypothetical protein
MTNSAIDPKWKIAYMHSPMYSSGDGTAPPAAAGGARSTLCQAWVDVVFAGHEHFYERMHPQGGIVYLIQGGSANLRRGNIRRNSPITQKGSTRSLVHLGEIVAIACTSNHLANRAIVVRR